MKAELLEDTKGSDAIVAMEFDRLSRYLTGMEASAYQIAKYVRFHHVRSPGAARRFDRFLDAAAARGYVGLALADAYSDGGRALTSCMPGGCGGAASRA